LHSESTEKLLDLFVIDRRIKFSVDFVVHHDFLFLVNQNNLFFKNSIFVFFRLENLFHKCIFWMQVSRSERGRDIEAKLLSLQDLETEVIDDDNDFIFS
jgi:hypothetical protein